jgi:hypothetical protein
MAERHNKKYHEKHVSFLMKNMHLPRRELVEVFNNTFSFSVNVHTLNSILYNNRLLSAAEKYTVEQDCFLFDNKELSTKKLCNEFNKKFGRDKTVSAINSRLNKLIRDAAGGKRTITINGRRLSLQQFVWECTNGPLPSNLTILFVDGNRENFSIGNLKAISKEAIRSAATKISRSIPRGSDNELKAANVAVSILQYHIQQHE